MADGWVYIAANRPNGTLYVGVTDLPRRAYADHHDLSQARQREQNMKHYPRARKVRLLLLNNPSWDDLHDKLA